MLHYQLNGVSERTPFCLSDAPCDTTLHDVDLISYLRCVSVQVSYDRLDQAALFVPRSDTPTDFIGKYYHMRIILPHLFHDAVNACLDTLRIILCIIIAAIYSHHTIYLVGYAVKNEIVKIIRWVTKYVSANNMSLVHSLHNIS